mgnify:FL=1
MKASVKKIIMGIFSIFLIIAIAGGGVIFLMFLIGLIIAGPIGNSLALNAKNTVMPIIIRAATIAVFSGLIYYYLNGQHTLTMDDNDQ